jgi:hypothetical protein
LFQTVYPAGVEQPLVDLPLSAPWVALALLLILIGIAAWPLLAIGTAGLALTAASAIFYAAMAPLERRRDNFRTRTMLAVIALIGPVARSYARLRRTFAGGFSRRGMAERGALKGSGGLTVALVSRSGSAQPDPDAVTESLRYALFRRGLVVAGNTGFEPFDLQILLGPVCRVSLNTLWDQNDGAMSLRWRLAAAPAPILAAAAIVLVLLAVRQWIPAIAVGAAAVLWAAALTIPPLTRLPATLKAALFEAMERLRTDAIIVAEGI